MRIKKWLIITITSLLVFVVVAISVAFYYQFKVALNERVLLQLTSIKGLKKNQIEEYLTREWRAFENSNQNFKATLPKKLAFQLETDDTYSASGVYDVSDLNPEGKLWIALIKKDVSGERIKLIEDTRIQNILLERTGLGESGETYLVGSDYRLRSRSRFFTKKRPTSIVAKTKAVTAVFSNKKGSGVFADYRGVVVHSAYEKISFSAINWAIVSEIDKEEVMLPLQLVRNKLFLIAFVILAIGGVISLYLANVFLRPILEMQNRLQSMAAGEYQVVHKTKNKLTEIESMFIALTELQNSLKGAVEFSTKIGEMDLKSTYDPVSANDLLGKSLLKMRDSLIEFRTKEEQYNSLMKKSLIEREELERKRISMELHDGIGPLLTTLKMYVQNNIKDAELKLEIKNLLDSTISEIRNITYALMPPSLIDFGIGQTLKGFVGKLQKNNEIKIRFDDDTKNDDTRMSLNLQINIFRICQELINNTLKHAQASQIILTLSELDEYVSLYYFDDGKGYIRDEVTLGSGLINIKERVDIFKGKINVNSKRNKTIVEIEIPIKDESN